MFINTSPGNNHIDVEYEKPDENILNKNLMFEIYVYWYQLYELSSAFANLNFQKYAYYHSIQEAEKKNIVKFKEKMFQRKREKE